MRFGADGRNSEDSRIVLQITKGWVTWSEKLVAETINEVIEPLIFEEALELIDHHMAQGDEVVSERLAREIVEPFAELLASPAPSLAREDRRTREVSLARWSSSPGRE